MADPRGFLKHPQRNEPVSRPVPVRLLDFEQVYQRPDRQVVQQQASRCMSCGVPFCHHGCPLGNLIPEWNDLVHQGDVASAIVRLHATNNFPEFTGMLCPAPCEPACVLGINQPPVTIKQVELDIVERAWELNLVQPAPPDRITGRTVAIVGSGPAGLACAQQLTRVGHTVVVYERDEAVGGLLRFGIPDYKMARSMIDRRVRQMTAEGTRFRTGVSVGGAGPNDMSGAALLDRFDAVVVATGASVARQVAVPGHDLKGVHYAMDYLPDVNRWVSSGREPQGAISAAGKDVVIIGGGDTGADCYGVALRQKAASVTQLDIHPKPPVERADHEPWPMYPRVLRHSSVYDEGGSREFGFATVGFGGDQHGQVQRVIVEQVAPGGDRTVTLPQTRRELPAQLVLLAIGFVGPECDPLAQQLGLEVKDGVRFDRAADFVAAENVFVVGDAGRGQSLIVWAIAEGRACAAAVDQALMGQSSLPTPVSATSQSLRA